MRGTIGEARRMPTTSLEVRVRGQLQGNNVCGHSIKPGELSCCQRLRFRARPGVRNPVRARIS